MDITEKNEISGVTDRSGTKEKNDSLDPEESPKAKPSPTRILISRVRPPQLWRKEISSSDVKGFLTQYGQNAECMRTSILNGMER